MAWLENAIYINNRTDAEVDFDEEFYICPECGEPVYNADWSLIHYQRFLCPICELTREDL